MNLELKKIKGFIFDLDGTLADTMPLHLEAWNELGNPLGLELSHEDHLRYAGMPTVAIAKKLAKERNIPLNAAEFVAKKEILFTKHKLPQVKIMQSVAPFLYDLQGKIPMAVGTGSTRETAQKVIDYLKVETYIKALVSADDVANHKPAPDTFLACAEQIKVAPENCLVFEDANLGMQAAKAGGMQAVNITEHSNEAMAKLLAELKNRH